MSKAIHLLVALAVSAPAAAAPLVPRSPAEAIAAADRGTRNGVSGRYEMIVAAGSRNDMAVFLNSLPDYRAPGNVTFSLSHAVAAKLATRFRVPPETYLLGRRVVVDGVIVKSAIWNSFSGRPHSFNRYGYTVRVERVAQIVSFD